ncbi:DUF2007 domain-containing protein [Stenotrophomonas sp. SY1]|jgi:hypothetical protein|uniref:putative signal transducing protein n=1 Tax=Stenotrophomonas sp. SY1 TaxID=477235 RepID=UPI001E29A4E0|nr:DUF2007 domain-containing protein [Stenotrophomonas sp. SY1]MCD9086038.1 DUF2007 domain-containing protein [Stenotrophomonas sp. SY1]
MQLVYQTNNLFDAHLVKHALEDAGIPAFVFGESLLGAGGELPLFGLLRVCVPDSAKPLADDVVAGLDLDAGPVDPISDDDEAPGLLPA